MPTKAELLKKKKEHKERIEWMKKEILPAVEEIFSLTKIFESYSDKP